MGLVWSRRIRTITDPSRPSLTLLDPPVTSRTLQDYSRPSWIFQESYGPSQTLLDIPDPPGPFQTSRPPWNLPDPLDLLGPSRTFRNPSGPFQTLPDPGSRNVREGPGGSGRV